MNEKLNLDTSADLEEDTEFDMSAILDEDEEDAPENLDANLVAEEDDAENISEDDMIPAGEEQLEEQENVAAISQYLDLYQQDHNPDHLFDYLKTLHTNFLQTMGIDSSSTKDQVMAQTPTVSEVPMVPATIETTEMKVELPSETAVDIKQ